MQAPTRSGSKLFHSIAADRASPFAPVRIAARGRASSWRALTVGA